MEFWAPVWRADRLEAPRPGEIAERPVRKAHIDPRVRGQRVARREFSLQHAVRNFQGRDALRG